MMKLRLALHRPCGLRSGFESTSVICISRMLVGFSVTSISSHEAYTSSTLYQPASAYGRGFFKDMIPAARHVLKKVTHATIPGLHQNVRATACHRIPTRLVILTPHSSLHTKCIRGTWLISLSFSPLDRVHSLSITGPAYRYL